MGAGFCSLYRDSLYQGLSVLFVSKQIGIQTLFLVLLFFSFQPTVVYSIVLFSITILVCLFYRTTIRHWSNESKISKQKRKVCNTNNIHGLGSWWRGHHKGDIHWACILVHQKLILQFGPDYLEPTMYFENNRQSLSSHLGLVISENSRCFACYL